jgi:pteridine reductase
VELVGKIALVTGAGHRLGREIALALAEEGCDLVVHYHGTAEEADRTVSEIRARGRRALLVKANLAQSEGVSSLFQAIDHGLGGPDILVNSAAIMQAVDFLEATEEDWRRTIDLNLKGSFFCLQQAAVRMRRRGGGAIVNISDVAGLRPWRRFPIHSISKSGVEMLTRVAAAALAPEIRVNAVAPGPVLKPEAMPDGRWQDLGSRLPLKHTGQPVDICRSVIFLLKNDFITGETLVVDGGNSLV